MLHEAIQTLSGPSVPPQSGAPAKQLIVLLHGVGADGDDLIGLAPHLGAMLPDAAFIAPNAPAPCDMAPYGYQWFSLQDRRPPALLAGTKMVAAAVNAFIDQQLQIRGLDDTRLALVGFSQGTMVSLYVALRRPRPCAAVVGFSGALVAPELLAAETISRPKVLLVHGDADDIVPVQALGAAVDALQAAGLPVESMVRPGLPHSIDGPGLLQAGEFLKEAFGQS
jgi:phospholipase/carboxylesterase